MGTHCGVTLHRRGVSYSSNWVRIVMKAADIMTHNVISVPPETTILRAAR
jgi:hypothetical protein